ncbi:uncharacterized protein LOC118509378 [Anopheles stephensi]|uniref:uncharacterized protein LOC118509378 n=1 Tax=Anopheles stephensi TaxID=30069 RepID=UPI001658857C|nr:uncharacterized protein LOC118509378 [Anopheles stephensi]
MKLVSVVLAVLLFGTVCSSYAIECMDVWDEESIAEMIEDDRRYEESVKAGHSHYEEDDCDEHPVDSEEATVPDTDEEDEDDDASDQAPVHHEVAHSAHTEQLRQKRESAVVQPEHPEAQGDAIDDGPSDLETAETHLFRPVFRYKSQYTERRRVRTLTGGVNVAPSQ